MVLLQGTKGVAGLAGDDAPGKQAGVRDSRKHGWPECVSPEQCLTQMCIFLFLCGYYTTPFAQHIFLFLLIKKKGSQLNYG